MYSADPPSSRSGKRTSAGCQSSGSKQRLRAVSGAFPAIGVTDRRVVVIAVHRRRPLLLPEKHHAPVQHLWTRAHTPRGATTLALPLALSKRRASIGSPPEAASRSAVAGASRHRLHTARKMRLHRQAQRCHQGRRAAALAAAASLSRVARMAPSLFSSSPNMSAVMRARTVASAIRRCQRERRRETL